MGDTPERGIYENTRNSASGLNGICRAIVLDYWAGNPALTLALLFLFLPFIMIKFSLNPSGFAPPIEPSF